MKIRLLLALAALTPLAVRADDTPAPVQVDGFTYVKTLGAVSEYTLDSNGLSVLLMPEHSAPVVTYMVTYHVGSRNEGLGVTGATHILEHMMFKGTDAHNDPQGNSIKQFYESVGALYNATTGQDRTNYFANLGSEHLESYIAIEADRMRHLWLHDSDRQKEMTVVRNEFERGENSPFMALYKEIYAAAYIAHPYHHPVIGWRSDIENVPIARLREFYDTFYWPNNATATIVGDFDPATALGYVKKAYGAYPRSPAPIPEVYTVEPEQSAPRRVAVKRAGQLGVVGIGYKIPRALDPDFPALSALTSILTDGKNSRLYKALVDKGLAAGANCYLDSAHDAALAIVIAPLTPGTTHQQVEDSIVAEIERVKKDGVTQAELDTAVSQSLAATAYGRDGSFSIASSINECIAIGDWTEYYHFDEKLKKVTPADIQRVANTYFTAEHSTTGWFIPNVPPADASAQQ